MLLHTEGIHGGILHHGAVVEGAAFGLVCVATGAGVDVTLVLADEFGLAVAVAQRVHIVVLVAVAAAGAGVGGVALLGAGGSGHLGGVAVGVGRDPGQVAAVVLQYIIVPAFQITGIMDCGSYIFKAIASNRRRCSIKIDRTQLFTVTERKPANCSILPKC